MGTGSLQAFARRGRCLSQPESYRVRPEANADASEYRFDVEFDPPLPSGRWGLIFGDVRTAQTSFADTASTAASVFRGKPAFALGSVPQAGRSAGPCAAASERNAERISVEGRRPNASVLNSS